MTENPYAMGPPPGYHPPPARELQDPAVQAETNTRGKAICRDVLATLPARKHHTTTCPTHPDQPGGRYGGGDLRCTPCRQTERNTP